MHLFGGGAHKALIGHVCGARRLATRLERCNAGVLLRNLALQVARVRMQRVALRTLLDQLALAGVERGQLALVRRRPFDERIDTRLSICAQWEHMMHDEWKQHSKIGQ